MKTRGLFMRRFDPKQPEGMILWGSLVCALILAALLVSRPSLEDRWPGRCVQLRAQLLEREEAFHRAVPPPAPPESLRERAWPLQWGSLQLSVPSTSWHSVQLQESAGAVRLALLSESAQLIIQPLPSAPLREQLALLLGPLSEQALSVIPNPSALLGEPLMRQTSPIAALALQSHQLLRLGLRHQPSRLSCQREGAPEEVAIARALSRKVAGGQIDESYQLADGGILSLRRSEGGLLWELQEYDQESKTRWRISWSLPRGAQQQIPLLQGRGPTEVPTWASLLSREAHIPANWESLKESWPEGAPKLVILPSLSPLIGSK
ncbi:MAG: hypothetical protein VYD19_10850 [Myxococcota bacterium]|nr:hypothetical protein [Myxococcota bacterium]